MATIARGHGRLPFLEQILFFRNKRNVLTESYLDVFGTEHDVAFMVAGANRDDLLADLREAIRKAIDEGGTLEGFRSDFDQIVARYGWEYTGGRNWRTRVIYETNLRQSYNAGRWQQFERLRRARPYLRYRHDDSVEHPRVIHESWDGIVLHIDDEWWHTHAPSNGWGCQCYLEALNERDLKRLGKSGPDTAPPVNWVPVSVGARSPGGPRLVMTPEGIDPGFAYAPGRSLGAWPRPQGGGPVTPPVLQGVMERAAQMALMKTARHPAAYAADSAARVLSLQRAADALLAGYAEFQATVLAVRQAQNLVYAVGAIEPAVVRALARAGIEPATAAIIVRDAEILHALRDAKAVARTRLGKPVALSAAELSELPALLRDPVAVLLDSSDNALLYVVNASSRRGVGKVVVKIDYRLKTQSGRETVNAFRTASLVDLVDVRADLGRGALTLLKGSLE